MTAGKGLTRGKKEFTPMPWQDYYEKMTDIKVNTDVTMTIFTLFVSCLVYYGSSVGFIFT